MTVEVRADNGRQAEREVRQAYGNEDYILDSKQFAGVEFNTKRKRYGRAA